MINDEQKELLSYKEILDMINKNGLSHEDLNEDIEILYSINSKQEIDNEKIKEFINVYHTLCYKQNTDLSEITEFLRPFDVIEKFKELISEFDKLKNVKLENLLQAKIEYFQVVLETINIEGSLKNNFFQIFKTHKFMEDNSFTKSFKNLLKLFIRMDLSLNKLIQISQTEELDLFLLFNLIRRYTDVPQKYLDKIKDEKSTISNLNESLLKDMNDGLISKELQSRLTNALEIYMNCSLRNINYFNVPSRFLELTIKDNLTIKDIDELKNMSLEIFDKDTIAEIKQSFAQKSNFELFLEENKINLNEQVINKYKYFDIPHLKKTLTLKSLLELNVNTDQKPGIFYINLLKNLKSYVEPNKETKNSISCIASELKKLIVCDDDDAFITDTDKVRFLSKIGRAHV